MTFQFSVAIPSYNAARHIGETLNSILGQTLPPAEIIVVDDGSTDDTAKIIKNFGDRVTYIRIGNSGPGAARKTAVEQCGHEWIALCDADDIWYPDHLERIAQLISLYPGANLLFSNFSSFGETAKTGHTGTTNMAGSWPHQFIESQNGDFVLLKNPYLAFLRGNHCAYPSGLVYRTAMYQKIGGIDIYFSRFTAEDAEFLRRFALDSDAVVAGDLKPTWGYRRHDSNFTAQGWQSDIGRADIFECHLKRGIIPQDFVSAASTEMNSSRLMGFNNAYWSGAWGGALAIYPLIPRAMITPKIVLRMIIAKTRFFLSHG